MRRAIIFGLSLMFSVLTIASFAASCHTSPIVITEMLVYPEGTQGYEYIEITNVSKNHVDLYDYKIIKTPMSVLNDLGYSHCYMADAAREKVLAPGKSALVIFISSGNFTYTPIGSDEKRSMITYENGELVYNMDLYDEAFARYTGVTSISDKVMIIFCPLVEWNGSAFVNGTYGVSLANGAAQTVGLAPRNASSAADVICRATNVVGEDGRAVCGKATHYGMPKATDSRDMAIVEALAKPTPGSVDYDIYDSMFKGAHDLVISEILANPEGTQGYEYIEITNTSKNTVDLYDYKLMKTPMSVANDLGYSYCYMADAPGTRVLSPGESALVIFISSNNHYYEPQDGSGVKSLISYENGEIVYDMALYNEVFERYTGVSSITEKTKLIFCPLVEWNGSAFVNGTYGVALGSTGTLTMYIAPRNATAVSQAICKATNVVDENNKAILGKSTRFVPSAYAGDITMRIEEEKAAPTPGTADISTPYVFSKTADVYKETAGMNRAVLYQVIPATSSQHMSYIVKTRSGKLIVYDGGKEGDGANLLSVLRTISGKQKPHVTAWFFSHMHTDHIGAIQSICADVTVDVVYYGTPTYDIMKMLTIDGNYESLIGAAQTALGSDGSLHFVHEGESIVIDGVEIEILFVPDMKRIIAMGNDSRRSVDANNWQNDTSIITRFHINDQTILFLGDCGGNEGTLLLEKYGNNLKSDFCQMAHHGQDGVDKPVYAAVNPEVCLYTAPDWLWNNTPGQLTIMETRRWMDEIGHYASLVAADGTYAVIFSQSGNKQDTPKPEKASQVGPLAITEICRAPSSIEYIEVQNISDFAVDLYDYRVWYAMGSASSDGTDLSAHAAQRFYRMSDAKGIDILMPGETILLWFITAANATEYADIDYEKKTITPNEAAYRARLYAQTGTELRAEQKCKGFSLAYIDGTAIVNETENRFNLGDAGTIRMWITPCYMNNAIEHTASAVLPCGLSSGEYHLPEKGTQMQEGAINTPTPASAPLLNKNGFYLSESYALMSLYVNEDTENAWLILAAYEANGAMTSVDMKPVSVKAGFFGYMDAFRSVAAQGKAFAAYLWRTDMQPVCIYKY